MREQVTIVLNEREPLKAKAAQTLLENLEANNITSSRVEIDQHIEKKLLEVNPSILILDYVLGDFSTGLDIVEAFQRENENCDTSFLFLTDEPSVEVAVNAMRLGAKHYLSIDDPRSLKMLLKEIDDILKRAPQRRPLYCPKPLSLNDLTTLSPIARKTAERAQTLITKRPPCIVLLGEKGSGKRTFARAMFHSLPTKGGISEIDLSLFTGNVRDCCKRDTGSDTFFELGNNLSLLIPHIECDDGELLEFLAQKQTTWWPQGASPSNNSFVLATTECEQTADTWERLLQAEILRIPSLDADRSDDFPGLIQVFHREAKQFVGSKAKSIEGESVAWLTQQEWPGNVAQLRSTIIDAIITQSHTGSALHDILVEHYALSQEQAQRDHETKNELDPLYVAQLLARNNLRYRVTAAQLGCSVSTLMKTVNTSTVSQEQ